MTAPMWIAMPPEVHSTLLSSGPGPGPLLAAAEAWSSMSAEYSAGADELTGLLGAAQASWDGPTAARYVAAHAPYLSWLSEGATKSAAAASLHQTAAAAYTTALATMPTLAELAANHAVHAALVATNFFGINTIPIAVNEADYARMWVQAAETMTTYQVVTGAALAAVPPTTPAPQIVAPGGEASGAAAATHSDAVAPAATTSWQDQLTYYLQQYTQNFAWPVSKDLNPAGWPIPAVPFVNSISGPLMQIPGMTPALATAIGWAVFHTAMIFWPFGQQAIQLAVSLAPALLALPVAGAAGAAAGGAAAAGIAVPVSVATPLASGVAAPAPAPAGMPAPAAAGSTPVSASSGPAIPSAAAPSPAPAIGGGTAGAGPGAGFGPTVTDGIGASLSDVLYAVGLSGLSARGSAGGRARRRSEEPAPDDADVPAPAAASAGRRRDHRRLRATAQDRAHRYEYMDLEPELIGPSDAGAEPFGFAGAAVKSGAGRAAGLATLSGAGWSDGPALPMLPGTWDGDGTD
ncbi:hypothetical protein A5672_13765 [Mycobacterium alsense]|uniref:PPE family protein n=1 Tax=Mycobacterium alsense TaxID=324058 RepID=A0ABD6P528_9MYCO|nr:PPE family protein [Mycobacterium alsense]OBG40532.1 hypothetical protein A5672_13765 [Mycobacterium alsense]OBI93265.1 hypothetical protein A5660_14910 [Mycobacterium alsense]